MSKDLTRPHSAGPHSGSSASRYEILAWRDKYVSRFERDMRREFVRLEKALLEQLNKNLKRAMVGGKQAFTSEILKPVVDDWANAVIYPILKDANEELQCLLPALDLPDGDDFEVAGIVKAMVPSVVVASGGVGVLIGGFWLGVSGSISGATFVGTTVMAGSVIVSLPIITASVVVGPILLVTGFWMLSSTRERVARAVAKSVIKKLRVSLIGGGDPLTGARQESLLLQLQGSICKASDQLIEHIC